MSERVAQLSIIDRLTDDEADGSSLTWGKSVQLLKKKVKEDLERLLNTRRTATPAPAELQEVADSIYHYGLPDINGATEVVNKKQWLCDQIKNAIEQFEPRLSKVRVEHVDPKKGQVVGGLDFQITGVLNTYPAPETVQFGTFLDASQSRFSVKYKE